MHKAFAPFILSIMLASCAAAPGASAQSSDAPRTITVTGEGVAKAAPDMAVISIGVRTEAPTAAAALRQNSADMSAAIATLKDLDVEDRDIQTAGLSINPQYNYDRNRSKPELVGFVASNTVTVRLRDLDRAGAVLDAAVQSGANSLSGISFAFSDPKPLQEEARKDAVADARAKAETLTEAAGVRLGEVLTIHSGYVATPVPGPQMARMEMAADSAVPLEAGESTLTANVTIVYRIN